MEKEKKVCKKCKRNLDSSWYYTYKNRGSRYTRTVCKICVCEESRIKYKAAVERGYKKKRKPSVT